MKYLKYFESEEEGREINLQQLWNDIVKYEDELKPTIWWTNEKIFENILYDIVINKRVEFHRGIHKIDGEISYAFDGIIKSLSITEYTKSFKVFVKLRDNGKFPTTRKRDLKYLLADILYYSRKPVIIKVYGEKTEKEKKIELLKSTEKYNL